MATAPTPGHRKRAKRNGFRVTLYGEVYELQLRDLGPSDVGLVRQTTGRSLNSYLADLDIDSIALIIWLARRKAGEKKLMLAKVFEMVPSQYEFSELMEAGTADFEVIEDVDEVDASVIDVDEVDTHPLPHAGS